MGFNSGFKGLTKSEYCIQQYPSNVNNWNANRTPKTRQGSVLILEA